MTASLFVHCRKCHALTAKSHFTAIGCGTCGARDAVDFIPETTKPDAANAGPSIQQSQAVGAQDESQHSK